MKPSEKIWKKNASIYEKILHHPFNVELAEGNLEVERFRFYLRQNAIYLKEFSRSLMLVATKAPNHETSQMLLKLAHDTVATEMAMHERYFIEWKVRPTTNPSPACFTYIHFVFSAVNRGGYLEGLAALLPGLWIYREMGRYILETARLGNPYQLWIDAYACEGFNKAVQYALGAFDEAYERETPAARQKAEENFAYASRLEWMFWESAYSLETWGPELEEKRACAALDSFSLSGI